jgi:uncharacterized protein YkwD
VQHHRSAVSLLRLGIALVIAALVLGSNPPPSATAADGPNGTSLAAAQSLALKVINEERDAEGLRPIRMDGRVRDVAQARSEDMAERDYFSHQDPDGKWPWDHLNTAGIGWYSAGEIIAWNMQSPVETSAAGAVAQWMASTMGHREQVLGTVHNYAGVGVAIDGARTIWTVIFIQGPDRTRPSASLTKASSAKGSKSISLAWSGTDPRLVTLTAGVRSYDVARRKRGGSWSTIRTGTTRTSLTGRYTVGARYEFRVRARDAAGNVGDWSSVKAVTVR